MQRLLFLPLLFALFLAQLELAIADTKAVFIKGRLM